jgi:hypothetical protein
MTEQAERRKLGGMYDVPNPRKLTWENNGRAEEQGRNTFRGSENLR